MCGLLVLSGLRETLRRVFISLRLVQLFYTEVLLLAIVSVAGNARLLATIGSHRVILATVNGALALNAGAGRS